MCACVLGMKSNRVDQGESHDTPVYCVNYIHVRGSLLHCGLTVRNGAGVLQCFTGSTMLHNQAAVNWTRQ